jgi:cell division protease FtsH
MQARFIPSLALALVAAATALLLAAAPAAAGLAWSPAERSTPTSDRGFVYSDLLAAMRAHRVREADLDPGDGEATVRLAGGRTVALSIPDEGDLAERLAAAGARVEVNESKGGPGALDVLAALAVVALLAVLILRRRRERSDADPAASTGTAAASPAERPGVRFADVAGCEEAVDEIREFVTFLGDPERFARLGARLPPGVLLHGPPGTGKTLLAKALAGEAGVSFFAASGSDFMDRYVGVGASRVRQLFAQARRVPRGAVVFIDEIDAIGKRRSNGSDSGHDERDLTLNQLLVELDGFKSRQRVVCVAATNRMEVLDPALLRPGRLSRHVLVDLPSAEGRRAILGVHARGKPLARDVDLDRLAEGTAGRAGADLADVINEGAIVAARAARREITHADLEEGHLRVLAGPAKRSSPLSDEERDVVARHEAGHALVSELCPSQDETQHLSIRPRGRAAGLAVTASRDRALHSTQHVHERLMVLLGGRAAERVAYGHVSSGAANDLEEANALARRAVAELGFSARAGQLVGGFAGRPVRLAESTHRVIDEEVERMIAEAYRDAIVLVEQHREQLERLARALTASESLDRLEITTALGEARPRRHARPNPGPRTEPALRPPAAGSPHARRERRRLAERLTPALPAAVQAVLDRAERGRRAAAR